MQPGKMEKMIAVIITKINIPFLFNQPSFKRKK
jgi:hypothetical protein